MNFLTGVTLVTTGIVMGMIITKNKQLRLENDILSEDVYVFYGKPKVN